MTEQPSEPLSLERARLLLAWLQAQRRVDSCLSELLAAGPAGERRVSGQIDRVSDLVRLAAEAFAAYEHSVRNPAPAGQEASPAAAPVLTSVPELEPSPQLGAFSG